MRILRLLLLPLAGCAIASAASDGNRLTYLDSDDPFYPGVNFPKLTTPQWVGEEGVDAVVILSIDDMRETQRYETFLRPILERLKKIDGRAPVSIMVNTIAPTNAQLQSWLKEGLSLECHTLAHPCPLCQKGDFNAAAQTYHDCVDLMGRISGNKPVAFRMPCCDSMNSPTPRFYAEIFNRRSPEGNFLSIDSSVMVILTTNDTSLPRELVMDTDGRERFRKYLPAETNATTRVSMGSFTTTIENYPYPYVINKLCWEFPCITPSDWEANNLHQPNNTKTVEDWQRALDSIVIKQGVMTFIFHPHGWIKSDQMVEFIEYAASKYGKRVKFLNFREAQERLNRHLLADNPLRAADGGDNGVRLADLNGDGWMDVMIGRRAHTASEHRTRMWNSAERKWSEGKLPFSFALQTADGSMTGSGVQLGIAEKQPLALWTGVANVWRFDGGQWRQDERLSEGLDFRELSFPSRVAPGLRLRDINNDGNCELVVANTTHNKIFEWNARESKWKPLAFALPEGTRIVGEIGRDAGLRFVDVDGDGYDDVIFSNHERYSLHLFRKDSRELRLRPGWTDEIISGPRVNPLTDPIPPIVRDGTNRNNGVWFKNGTMWIQNEDTAHLPDKVDRRTFKQLLTGFLPPPLSPDESLKAIHVRPGFKVELVASEPLVHSPVAFEWSADGRLWVVEMSDYPNGIDGKGKGGGRVRVLKDTNGDGRYDEAATFLDGLSFPNGIYPWRKGVVISAAPESFYAEDANGDGKADVREVLFTGFTPGNQQHRMNGFDYGLDGWLYGANGDSGGNVRAVGFADGTRSPSFSPQRGEDQTEAVNIRGRDFRFHPDTRVFEAIAGQTQFGRHRDDFGNWFGNNNPNWAWHYFFPEHYLERNPLLPLKTTKKVLANYAESSRCFPISRLMSRFNDAHTANHTTSANSATPYRDELFGPEFATSVFVSEPVHNLIHREVVAPDGVTFTSSRADSERESEFLASTDNWFRPTMLKTGPDGALYIADMYRLVIEHPEWIPAEMQKRYDSRAGADKGRIFRVVPDGAKLRPIVNLVHFSSGELAAALDSPNGWTRDTAQRLLIERGDKSVTPQLEALVKNAKSAKVRVQALWTLRGLGALTPQMLQQALSDAEPAVREHAVQLSEPFSGDADLGRRLFALVRDSSVRVRYQLAFTLGERSDALAADALLDLARDGDENIHNAVLTSLPRHAKAMLAKTEALPSKDSARGLLPMLHKLVSRPALKAGSRVTERTNTISAAHRAERAKVLARYADVANLRGDAQNGAAHFQQQCAQCHRFKGQGTEIGPDLATMAGKPVEQLVQAIFDPNAAVEQRYQNFTVITRGGEEVSGIIIAETPTTLTLRAPNRVDATLLRADLKEISASGLSLMPDGLEAAFTPRQLADLLAYVLGL